MVISRTEGRCLLGDCEAGDLPAHSSRELRRDVRPDALRAQRILRCRGVRYHAFCQVLSVTFQAIKALCGYIHDCGVGNGLSNERSASMVQNRGLLAIAHLETFHRHLIESRFGLIFVLIADDIDVTL